MPVALAITYCCQLHYIGGRMLLQAERGSRQAEHYSFSSYSVFNLGTTAGSARVVVSPSALPSAMSRSRRRMIFPERVFGRSAAKLKSYGRARAPMFLATR